jgi:hypothetical protein
LNSAARECVWTSKALAPPRARALTFAEQVNLMTNAKRLPERGIMGKGTFFVRRGKNTNNLRVAVSFGRHDEQRILRMLVKRYPTLAQKLVDAL